MVKIRVLYDNEKEFNKVLKYLLPVLRSVKKAGNNSRTIHKRAYIDTNISIDSKH